MQEQQIRDMMFHFTMRYAVLAQVPAHACFVVTRALTLPCSCLLAVCAWCAGMCADSHRLQAVWSVDSQYGQV